MNNLLKRAKIEIKPDEDLILLSIASGILASFGIFLDDSFVLLGAMLVAPFFDPLISFVVFLFFKKWKNLLQAVASFVLITLISLITSILVFTIVQQYQDIRQVSFSLFLQYEYFFIALVLGVIGTLLWMWPKSSNTSAGLSIAISLIPPLANIGRGIVLFDTKIVTEYSVIFILNTIGIIAGALLTIIIKKGHK